MAAARNKRVVIKLGTGVLTRGVGELDTERMRAICEQIALALKNGWQPILVSSGAVGLGMGRLGLKLRPKKISSVQKCAAVGQGILIQTWAELFQPFNVCVAQILLTRDDLDVRSRYRAMRDLLDELLGDRIVPIINENDCISAAELNIKFGDNDVLSSLVASLSKASKLLILSTAPGLVDMGGTGEIIKDVQKIDDSVRSKAGGTSSATAVGGMITKIKAAEIAASSGCEVFIASGARENVITEILSGENPGTRFAATPSETSSKKRWLAHFGRTIGKILVDKGAADAIRNRGSSLLPAGVRGVVGRFAKGSLVEIADSESGDIVARGLAEENSDKIKESLQSTNKKKCGHKDVVVHRDNLAVV